jgi:hypothetical protein
VNRIIEMLIELCKCQWKTRESQDQKGRLCVGYCVGKPERQTMRRVLRKKRETRKGRQGKA